jgi:hypothetical protein
MVFTSCVAWASLRAQGCGCILGREHKRWEAGELKHIKKIGREIKEGKGENKRGIMSVGTRLKVKKEKRGLEDL